MEEVIDGLKNRWNQIVKFSLFIFGIVAVLITAPPVENFNGNVIRFLIAVIIAFFLIPLFLYKQKKYFRKWLFFSVLMFILACLSLIFYNISFSKYVINYYGNHQIVIGRTFSDSGLIKIEKLNKEDNQTYQDGSPEHNKTLLKYAIGNAEEFWDYHEINNNKILLVTLFYLSISFITILLLCITQTVQILYSK